MNYRRLGRTNYELSEVGYGTWGISGTHWMGGTDEESLSSLRLAIEMGVNFIDTALSYGFGHSEQLVGKAVREAGRTIYVATKVPPKNKLWPARRGIGIDKVFPEQYIVRAAEQSLRNLGLDTIDLLQLHVWNEEWIERDEWRNAFARLKAAGKIRGVGLSINDHEPDSALGAIDTGLIDAVQVIYNIFDQSPEQRLFPKCLERNIGVIARVPLDEGGLTGNITEGTTFTEGDFRNEYFRGDRKRQVAEHVAELRRDLGSPNGHLPEMALRFCLSHPAVSSVIPGMRSRRNVIANCSLSDQGPLTPEVLAVLRRHAWTRNFYD